MPIAVQSETQHAKFANTATWSPRIIAFVCHWSTYAGASVAGSSLLPANSNVRIVRLTCGSRVDPLLIVKAFENDADGVIVSECPIQDCHYSPGNDHARRLRSVLHDLLGILGVEEERVTFSSAPASEREKWQEVIRETSEKIRRLGPLRRLDQREVLWQ
jgi:F420-non-reducing hydrogenase iron-sulfur subunit